MAVAAVMLRKVEEALVRVVDGEGLPTGEAAAEAEEEAIGVVVAEAVSSG